MIDNNEFNNLGNIWDDGSCSWGTENLSDLHRLLDDEGDRPFPDEQAVESRSARREAQESPARSRRAAKAPKEPAKKPKASKAKPEKEKSPKKEKSKKKRSYNRVKKASRPSAGESIENRPKEINDRETFGHWEMDCVEGKKKTKKTLLI